MSAVVEPGLRGSRTASQVISGTVSATTVAARAAVIGCGDPEVPVGARAPPAAQPSSAAISTTGQATAQRSRTSLAVEAPRARCKRRCVCLRRNSSRTATVTVASATAARASTANVASSLACWSWAVKAASRGVRESVTSRDPVAWPPMWQLMSLVIGSTP